MGKKSKAKRKNNNKSKPKNVIDTTVTDTPAVTEEVTAETVEQVDTPVADVVEEVVESNESETSVSKEAETETPEDAKPEIDAEKEADETVKDETEEPVQDDAPVETENDVTEEVEAEAEVDQEAPVEETVKEEEIVEQEPSIEEPSTDEVTQEMESSDPRPIVIAGPSGAGKGTLINILMKKFPNDQFGFSVSHTTRNPREGEVNGVHYNFSTVDAMKEEIDDGKFIEYAEVHGNYYGTSVEAVRSVQSKGQVCILDIDCQGVRNVKSSSLDPYYIFIAPPSMQDLENRLRGRGTEKEEDIVKRLANAQGEMDYGQEKGNFDKYLVNDDLKTSSEELCSIIQTWYPHLVPDETPKENEDVAVEEAVGKEEEKTVEQAEIAEEEAPDDEVNMDASEATTEVVDNCSLENEETNEEKTIEPEVDAPMDEVSPSDEEKEVAEEQVDEVKESNVDEEHPEDECEKVDEPQSPELVTETKVEDAKVTEPSTPEPVEVKPVVIESPEVVKEEPKEEPKSIPTEEPKEVVPDVNPNKTYYNLEELKMPIEGVEWAQRENFLSDEDIQTHFGMNRDELLKLPKWKKQAAKKKLGIF